MPNEIKEVIVIWHLFFELSPLMPNFKAIDMNIFTACEIFFTFLEAKPCFQR